MQEQQQVTGKRADGVKRTRRVLVFAGTRRGYRGIVRVRDVVDARSWEALAAAYRLTGGTRAAL